ncbi:MAG: PaaI family thioesterase [Deltaproteobacteria bacterium]|nr:PaaI family thioesterase [Deltaproteobacteria bacterium]
MKKPNPKHIKTICDQVNISPYPSLLSMNLVDIGIGFAEVQIITEDKHLQLLGAVHGGVLASLIDTVAFWAVYFGIDNHDAWLTSVDLKLNYLAPATSGKLIARGRQIKVGKKLCYAEAQVNTEDGRIIAHGTSTLMIMPELKMPAGFIFPPKFIED